MRELFREFVIARRRLEDQYQRDVTQAWWVVRIYLMTLQKKRLPDLLTLIRSPRRRPEQSYAEMHAALELMSRQYGIPLKQVH